MDEKLRLLVALIVMTGLLGAALITGWLNNLLTSPNLTRIIVGETNIGSGLILFVYLALWLAVVWGWIRLFRE